MQLGDTGISHRGWAGFSLPKLFALTMGRVSATIYVVRRLSNCLKLEVDHLASIGLTFKALSDPNRRKILQLLKQADMAAGELAEHFTITKPSLSHHLSVLKQAGLVSDERQGQNIIYSLESTVFQDIIAWLMEYTAGEDTDREGRDDRE